ncbi:hypothetical protein NPIL_188411 [Nephila pilipes]|uniref:Uncharacterized protein n=1 Tax=Nephila pilipes TaxID=299642 RepID=A0A8X6PN87_NEPPI|nr:hypothetical protein NPIL_188411 [Nephila pilipes]
MSRRARHKKRSAASAGQDIRRSTYNGAMPRHMAQCSQHAAPPNSTAATAPNQRYRRKSGATKTAVTHTKRQKIACQSTNAVYRSAGLQIQQPNHATADERTRYNVICHTPIHTTANHVTKRGEEI